MRDIRGDERGFALLELLVACALVAMLAIVFATAFGGRPARSHAAAMSLEMALGEARTLAAANANAADAAYPTGSTVVVEDDPQAAGATRIAVYRSRPVSLGQRHFAPPPDVGFPPQRVFGRFQFASDDAPPIAQPFAIMLSGAGYASVQRLRGTYNEHDPTFYSVDPGCNAAGARLQVSDGSSTETHAFGCTGGAFRAN